MHKMRFGWMVALLGLMALGCGDDDKDDSVNESTALEIIGEYDDNYGGEQIITADAWNGAVIAGFDNAKNAVFTQFPEDDMYNPSKFAKTVYTQPEGGSFYFCMVEFSLDTLEDAEASKEAADDSDPETTGCGGEFPWTKATAKE